MTEHSSSHTQSATDAPGPTVTNNTSRHRYEISLGIEVAGFAQYLDRDGQRIFFHTEIDEQFSGQGLARTLVSKALSDTRSSDKRIVPVCPYVAKYLKTHHDYDDIKDPVTPAALAAVDTAG